MSKRTLPRRVAGRQSYREPLYDSDYDYLPEKNTRPSRHSARLQAAYEELSNTDAQSRSENELPPPVRRARKSRPTKRKTRSTTSNIKDNTFQSFKRRKTTHVSQKMRSPSKPLERKSATKVVSRGIIPRWQDLEYQILVKIMKYAAYPLYSGASNDTGSTKWLLRISILSHSFHEAAIGALLFSPPLLPVHRAHSLIGLLKLSKQEFGDNMDEPKQKKSSKISMDYRKMIQHLSLEAKSLLASKSGIALDDLLQNTPVLKSLIFYHNHDFVANKVIWAHPNYSRAKNKWRYTQLYPILDTLQHTLSLRDFEWNARFLTKDDGVLLKFREAHNSTRHFSGLRSVTLRNFIMDGVEKLNETVKGTSLIDGPDHKANASQARLMTWRMSLKEALFKYKELERLSICNSNVFDNAFLGVLPIGLRRLEIENCPIITSEGLQSYLAKSGGQLRELVLKGNQYMSLDFTTVLKEYTPRLAVLDIDLVYKDPTSYQDTEPLFDSLLPNGPPSWPESLQQISVGPLRRLSTQDAEKFYQSLIGAAEQLTYLRVLELRTLLNEAGWRDRAALRAKWLATFDRVFNAKHNPNIKPPSPVNSIPRPKVEVKIQVRKRPTEDAQTRDNQDTQFFHSPKRKSRRIQDLALSDSQGQMSDSPNDAPSPTYSALLDGFNGEDRKAANTTESEIYPRQGRCHIVTFELSDQRPAQDQFKEDDFLDDEADLEEDSDFRA